MTDSRGLSVSIQWVRPMDTRSFDVMVIGSGPGGEGAAMKLAKEGKSVAVVERMSQVGGYCTHAGTIPSKALRQAVQNLLEVSRSPIFRQSQREFQPTFPDMLRAADSVIRRQIELRTGFYERNRVPVFTGRARFVGPHALEVDGDKGARERFEARHFVIAAGSRPYRPADVDFTHPRIFDSNTILTMPYTPQSVTIYGAGVIGCEYASIFRQFGLKVNLINGRGKLLEFLDDEIIDALAYHLRDQGVLIRHNEEYASVEAEKEEVFLNLKSGKRLRTDILLWANGRTGNSNELGLEALGIQPDQRGNLSVNESYQTAVPHIYAVGDIVGFPSLASAAYDQGRCAATHIAYGKCDARLIREIPTGIYTSPEISSIGKTERDLTAEKIPYEVGHAFFKHLARAQITGQAVGMLKILFHRETLQILGIHCFGKEAAEIIHIGQAILSQPGENNTLLYFANTTFNYPTMAEAYRVAALNGLNRVF